MSTFPQHFSVSIAAPSINVRLCAPSLCPPASPIWANTFSINVINWRKYAFSPPRPLTSRPLSNRRSVVSSVCPPPHLRHTKKRQAGKISTWHHYDGELETRNQKLLFVTLESYSMRFAAYVVSRNMTFPYQIEERQRQTLHDV